MICIFLKQRYFSNNNSKNLISAVSLILYILNYLKYKTMTNLIEMLVIPAVAIGTYIFVSKHITKFFMNKGMNENQIIESHKNESGRKYFVKYPEAEIRTSKHLLLAFGFIFAFASSIYAFNIIGKTQQAYELTALETEIDFDLQTPIINMKEKVFEKREIPKAVEVISKIKIVEKIPEIIEKKIVETKVVEKRNVMPKDFIIPTDEPLAIIEEEFVVVQSMPRFENCQGLTENEAIRCTNLKIQQYVMTIDIPEIVLDNPEMGGIVYVSFLIGKKGQVEDVKILKGTSKILDRAVKKHVENMPKFASAGKQRGKAVKVRYKIPVNIILE